MQDTGATPDKNTTAENNEVKKSAATGKFTTLQGEALKASMAKIEGVAVIATVNEDGSPNAAIFIPMMPDVDHVVMGLAHNRTRDNIERTRECMLAYEVLDTSAQSKEERYKGARLRLELINSSDDEYAQVEASWPHMNPSVLVFRIAERMPLG